MSGDLHITSVGIEAAERTLTKLGRVFEAEQLVQALGRLGQRQTKLRIRSEKRAPDGAAWAKTRDGRGALFIDGRHLSAGIRTASSGHKAIWGTDWIGAKVHQFGAIIKPVNARALVFQAGGRTIFARKVIIPARPYLGLSSRNQTEIIDTTQKFLARFMK